jgi:mono/diheme cytochrome c family protein
MIVLRVRLALLALAGGMLLAPGLAGSAEPEPGQNAAPDAAPTTITEAERTDAKAIFAAQCGWCHGGFGMTPDKGPRLAGTEMTQEQVEQRIRNGKMGYMPSFRKHLNDAQITLMARYIKSLQPPP